MATDWELFCKIKRLKKHFKELVLKIIDALLGEQNNGDEA